MQKDTLAIHSDDPFHAIRANDEKALQIFYRNNYPKVTKYVLENSGTIDEAKDIYQEAFIAMWRNIQLGKFNPEQGGSLDGYIYTIARNKWLDQLRSTKSRKVIPLTDSINQPDAAGTAGEDEEKIEKIKANFTLLGEQCRDVLERFYYRKESMRTIATAMNWTEATAKNNKYRCLERLRELLKTNNNQS